VIFLHLELLCGYLLIFHRGSKKVKSSGGFVYRVIQVTAAIIVRDNDVLLAKRGRFSALSGLWEFPGGKIETGETPAVALERELKEELGIRIEPYSIAPFDVSFYEYGAKRILLIGMRVGAYSGTIRAVEHAEVRWFDIGELETIRLAPADVPFARRLLRSYSARGKRIRRFTRRSNISAGTGPLK
jgi:8-oxo-dGTP diphosphatase